MAASAVTSSARCDMRGGGDDAVGRVCGKGLVQFLGEDDDFGRYRNFRNAHPPRSTPKFVEGFAGLMGRFFRYSMAISQKVKDETRQ